MNSFDQLTVSLTILLEWAFDVVILPTNHANFYVVLQVQDSLHFKTIDKFSNQIGSMMLSHNLTF